MSHEGDNPQLHSEASNKIKKSVLNDQSNKNIHANTSIDQIKKEDNKSKHQENAGIENIDDQTSEQIGLQKQKLQGTKISQDVKKKQKQVSLMGQKSSQKLPNIRQSLANKENQQDKQIKKSQPLSVHSKPQNPQPENNLKRNKNYSHFEGNYSLVNGRKVYMSEDDVAKLKKLKIDYKKREQQIKKKVVARELLVEQLKTEQIMQKEKKVEEERQKRLKSIQERLKIAQKERHQRLERYQEENRRLKELKQSKKLFEKLEEDFQKIQERQKLNLEEMIKSRVGQATVNFDQIKQHEKQYLERKEQNLENSRVRIKSKIKQMEEEYHHLNLHKSQFYEKIKHQKKQMLHEMEENERRRKVCIEKIKQYKDVVRENYMPSVHKVQKPQEPKRPRYNHSQIHSMGNDYMKQGGKLIDRNKSLNLLENIRKSEAQTTSKKVYKNYLRENRTESSPHKSKSKTKTEEALIEKELKSINAIKNPKQKYEKIKILHNKIEKDLKSSLQVGGKIKLKSQKTANIENQSQVKQIKAKLQLLQGLEN